MSPIGAAIDHLVAERDRIEHALTVLRSLASAPATSLEASEPAPTPAAAPARAPRHTKAAAPPAAPKKQKTATAVGASPPAKATGRPLGEIAQACRAHVLQTLARHPASMTFRELRTAVAPVLEKLGVQELALDTLLYAQTGAMKTKGWLRRLAGAWAITDAGRAEVTRLRDVVRSEGPKG